MSNDVWALAELNNGKLAAISLQLARKAAELAGAFGGESAAVAFGVNTAAARKSLARVASRPSTPPKARSTTIPLQPHAETLAA